MIRRLVLALVLMLVAFAGACSHGEAGSCYRQSENICIEYTPAQGIAGKRMCGPAWAAGAQSCATALRLGACTKKDGTEYFYSGGPNNYSPASARTVCVAKGGSFTP